ncbi:MAG: hypothetical protein EOO05_14095 [Chitinophagaceae bacterium]|nr:MAG: hypothetical protein EOO05_14095 [Chitinophagaceae bacterium]
MRIIPSSIHGVLDFVVSIFVIASPWLLGFHDNSAQTWVPVTLGIATIFYSLFTRYELGAVRVIDMRTHLTLDFLSAVVLLTSPWLFGFDQRVYIPHVVIGITELLVTLLSKTKSRAFNPAA